MKEMIIEWQLPVTDDIVNGTGFHIRNNCKVHCFVNGQSLCKKYWLIPDYWETTDCTEEDISDTPSSFCKKCVEKFQKLKI